MVVNRTLMQFQADMLGVPVIRPSCVETTALGAAYAAGLAIGAWSGPEELRANWAETERWQPTLDIDARTQRESGWRKAVDRSLGWA
jgi:glycerol kinase